MMDRQLSNHHSLDDIYSYYILISKTIVISATVKNDIINYNDKLLNLKVDKFLEKPLPLQELKNEIKKLID